MNGVTIPPDVAMTAQKPDLVIINRSDISGYIASQLHGQIYLAIYPIAILPEVTGYVSQFCHILAMPQNQAKLSLLLVGNTASDIWVYSQLYLAKYPVISSYIASSYETRYIWLYSKISMLKCLAEKVQ